MISVGSREGFSRRDILMDDNDAELEEGEACSYHDDDNDDDDPTIDPDVALSYIGEKLQNVLGHFQKDFEGLVSADSLGPKNGEYGTFLPAYRRSPLSHPRSPPRVQNRSTSQPPSTSIAEGRNHNSLATANVSHSVKRGSASAYPASSTISNPLSQNERCVQISRSQSVQEGLAPKSENRDQRTLKVRIKVGADNLSLKKNTAIYSGLGLEGSPSSSLDDSLKESQGLPSKQAYDSSESPTQILHMMTSFPLFGGCVLSPLTENLLHISETPKLLPNIPVRPSAKVNQRPSFSVKENKALPEENTMSFVDKEGLYLQSKGESNDRPLKDSSVDAVSCDELISNALKLPLLSDSYGNKKEDFYSDTRKSSTVKPNGVVKADGKVIDTNETMTHLDNSIKHKDLGKQVAHQSSKRGDGMVSGNEMSSSGSRKKTKKGRVNGSATGKLVAERAKDVRRDRKNLDTEFPTFKSEGENLSSEKQVKKMKDTYSDFFGNLSDHEDETMNSPMPFKERLKSPEVVEKATLAYENSAKEKTRSVQVRGEITSEMKNTNKSRRKKVSETPISGPSHNAFVPENGQHMSDQAFVGDDSDVWVQCDECKTWRLLPPGTKEDELPDKWRCSLQTWLPNLNSCGISEEEGIKIVRARYNPLPEISNGLDVPLGKFATGADILHPIVSNDQKLKKPSKSPSRYSLNGSSSSLKMKHKSAKVRTSAKSKDNQLTNAQQAKSSDMSMETNKRKTSNQLQPDSHSDGGNFKSPKIKARRDSDRVFPRPSKRTKTRELPSGDMNRENSIVKGNEMFGVRSGNGVVADTAGKDQMMNSEFVSFGNLKGETGGKRSKQEPNAFPAPGSMHNSKSDSGNIAPKKRKHDSFENPPNSTPSSGKEMDGNEQSKSKRHRMSKSEAKEASTSKRNGKTDRKSRSISRNITDNNEPSQKGSSSANGAATSSSSKATISLKVKYKFQEMKGSPVESVSSSPLRSSIKLASKGTVEKDAVEAGADHKSQKSSQIDVQDKTHDVADKILSSKFDSEKDGVRISESYVNMPDNMEACEDGENDRNNRVQDNFDCNVDKYGQDTVENQEPSIPECKGQGNDEKRASKILDSEKHEPLQSMSMKDKSQCLPPFDGMKNETLTTAQLSQGNNMSAPCTDDYSKEAQVNKKTDSQNGTRHGLSKHSVSNGHRIKIKETPSPHRRDSLSQAASSAIKEAKGLKHLADRLKNADSMESTGLYFEAALKFLHGASILESGKTENAKQGDIVQAMQIYSDTAKLCRFCAHEYEKSKDMATAALAYKCMEVAYMRVVYSSHNIASRDRSELQAVLQMVPPGESPSSSASDIDNLNNSAIGDKAAQARSVDSPLPAGNLVIAARNRQNFSRLLSFTQDVNSAMEASRKSHIAFGAATATMGHIITMDGITSIKRALDFNFHDVEGLLRLVRLAKDATSH